MHNAATRTKTSAGWLEALAESEAELAAGQPTVSREVVQRMFRASIARLEAKKGGASPRKAAARR
jgi:hypothetical protein